MRELKDVFAIWPSIAEMARDVGRPYITVYQWQRRGRIPPEAFDALIAAAAGRDVSLTHRALINLNAPRDNAQTGT